MTATMTPSGRSPVSASPPISREILEDRFDRLIVDETDGFTKLGLRLYLTVQALIERTAGSPTDDSIERHGGATEVVKTIIRETVIREIETRGLAR